MADCCSSLGQMSVVEDQDLLDVRQAAALVDRHPETIRRWIWSGKLAATRNGNRFLVERNALLTASGETASKLTLAEWAEKAREVRGPRVERAEWNVADEISRDWEERAERLLDRADR